LDFPEKQAVSERRGYNVTAPVPQPGQGNSLNYRGGAMHPPLADWGEEYVREVATKSEGFDLEKKANVKFNPENDKRGTEAELAKQVCAFANASNGVLIYGVADNGTLDPGVPEYGSASGGHSRQSAKAWVDQAIPRLVTPPPAEFQTRHIHLPGHHAPGYGVLVVEVPASNRRPHWITEAGKEIPYIRAGEHSYPMSLQTFLDISSRTAAAAGDIRELGQIGDAEFNQQTSTWVMRFNPIVELITGPPCELWSLVIRLQPHTPGEFRVPGLCNATVVEPNAVTFHGVRPLFPRAPTRVCQENIELWSSILPGVQASLSVGAAHPVVKTFQFAA
jgi:hypothetical protein